MKKIALVSLGCAKNQVDSEAILALFKEPHFEIVSSLNEADVIIINTCGFILSAKKENIDTILDCLTYKKKTIVVGCLVERYFEELKEAIPEVDLWIPFKDEYQKLPSLVSKMFGDEVTLPAFDIKERINNDKAITYLKIAEGCNKFCAYCAIPYIRGRFVSYPIEELVTYAKKVAKKGVKELVLIAQDPTSYGKDFKEKKCTLVDLLTELDKIPEIEFIKTLYLYPDGLSDELIDFIKTHPKCSHYFDIPLQHISDPLLKAMNRKDDKETIVSLIKKIKREIPDAILRTTLIVGFPGESKKEFDELKEFVNEFKFNHLGVFTYSREEGTKAYSLPHQVRESTKIKRKQEIMELQAKISYALNKEMIGRVFKALIIDEKKNEYLLSCDFNAPDDVDGKVILLKKKDHQIGDVVNVKVVNSFVYDLLVEEI